jgi:hypothetical protein
LADDGLGGCAMDTAAAAGRDPIKMVAERAVKFIVRVRILLLSRLTVHPFREVSTCVYNGIFSLSMKLFLFAMVVFAYMQKVLVHAYIMV